MKYETAGDPITGLKWTRRTCEKIAKELKSIEIKISENTVAKLLKKMGFSLRVNHKKIQAGVKVKPEDRNKQFSYINDMREEFSKNSDPTISVDTKKKELIGNFKNKGKSWTQEPTLVNDHDFKSIATAKAIPYGIYEDLKNRGSIFIGTSFDTPAFAVDCIEKWWRIEGSKIYPNSKKLLILADSGGSNSARSRVWKYGIQEKLCDQHGLSVNVCHYPAGSSKWNPIEHKLFCEISKNWAAKPLTSFEVMIKYINTTKTKTGLKTNAYMVWKKYEKGEKISNQQMETIAIKRDDVFPQWNYTITNRKM